MSKKNEIIDAAWLLFQEGGPEAVTVRHVADRAGVGVGTMRHYFPTQKDLLTQLSRHAMKTSLSDCNIEDVSISAVERLKECISQFLPQTEKDESVLLVCATSLNACFAKGSLVGQSQYTELSQAGEEKIAYWFQRVQQQGTLLNAPPDVAARLVSHMANGLVMALIYEGQPVPAVQHWEDLEAMLALLVDEKRLQAAKPQGKQRREANPAHPQTNVLENT